MDRVTDLPIIDISSPNETNSKELLDAASRYGFVYIRFRSLPLESKDVDKAFDIVSDDQYRDHVYSNLRVHKSREFFKSPISEKEAVKIGPDVGSLGTFREPPQGSSIGFTASAITSCVDYRSSGVHLGYNVLLIVARKDMGWSAPYGEKLDNDDSQVSKATSIVSVGFLTHHGQKGDFKESATFPPHYDAPG